MLKLIYVETDKKKTSGKESFCIVFNLQFKNCFNAKNAPQFEVNPLKGASPDTNDKSVRTYYYDDLLYMS